MRIEAKNLIKIYGDRSVVNDVSFYIDKGEVGIECYNSINHDYLYSWKRVIASYKRNYLNGFVYW